MHRRHRVRKTTAAVGIGLSAGLLLASALVVPSTTAGASTFPGNNGLIVFSGRAAVGDDVEIRVVASDGSGLTTLTDNDARDLNPSWSADGTKIVYSSWPAGDVEGTQRDIWVMNADGSGQTQLTTDGAFADDDPSFSPDGAHVIFARREPGVARHIMRIDIDGDNEVTLASGLSHTVDPTYSPDGSKIAYSGPRAEPAGSALWTMDADGSNQTMVIDAASRPCWAPSGNQLTYVGRDSRLWVVNADGTGATPITRATFRVSDGCFSNDGTQVAATVADRMSLDSQIYVGGADGADLVSITEGFNDIWSLDWQPVAVPVPPSSTTTSTTAPPTTSTTAKAAAAVTTPRFAG